MQHLFVRVQWGMTYDQFKTTMYVALNLLRRTSWSSVEAVRSLNSGDSSSTPEAEPAGYGSSRPGLCIVTRLRAVSIH